LNNGAELPKVEALLDPVSTAGFGNPMVKLKLNLFSLSCFLVESHDMGKDIRREFSVRGTRQLATATTGECVPIRRYSERSNFNKFLRVPFIENGGIVEFVSLIECSDGLVGAFVYDLIATFLLKLVRENRDHFKSSNSFIKKIASILVDEKVVNEDESIKVVLAAFLANGLIGNRDSTEITELIMRI
jgi:hypothetical protein